MGTVSEMDEPVQGSAAIGHNRQGSIQSANLNNYDSQERINENQVRMPQPSSSIPSDINHPAERRQFVGAQMFQVEDANENRVDPSDQSILEEDEPMSNG